MADLDTMPAPEEGEKHEKQEELPEENSPWRVYLQPKWWTILMNKNKLIYGLNYGFYYLVQFIGCCAVINLYGDVDRLIPCQTTGELSDGVKSSQVYDMALYLLAIYHIIEWLRTTILLILVCMGGGLAIVYYITMANIVYGIVTYAFVHEAYFGERGMQCRAAQENRAAWLLVEVIVFWVLFFIYSFPFIFTLCLGKSRADATLKKAMEESEEED